jgi:hypothetical protein
VTSTLNFDEASHTYTVGGLVVPSVTQLLAPLRDFSMVPPKILEAKRALGVAVHLATELDDEGTLDERSVHPRVRPFLDAYRRWRTEMKVTVLSSEQRVWHPTLRYAGTFDCKVQIAGQKWVVDKKTALTEHPSWALQTSAYREPLPDKAELQCASLLLHPDGTYGWRPYDAPKHRGDFGIFCTYISQHHWKKANGLL